MNKMKESKTMGQKTSDDSDNKGKSPSILHAMENSAPNVLTLYESLEALMDLGVFPTKREIGSFIEFLQKDELNDSTDALGSKKTSQVLFKKRLYTDLY